MSDKNKTENVSENSGVSAHVQTLVIKPETGWGIYGIYGFYTNWWLLRKSAINEHCEAKGKTWKQCKLDGDRCIKIEIRAL